jgi:hypothetical protein
MNPKTVLNLALSVFLSFCGVSNAAIIGPIPYESIADSPFDMSGLGETFFVEDFSNGVEVVSFIDSDGFTQDVGMLSSPGVTVSTGPWWSGDRHPARLRVFSHFVDHAARAWSADVTLTFDATALGALPQAVGFSFTSSVPYSIEFYGIHQRLIASLDVPSLPPVMLPDGGSSIAFQHNRFIGVVDSNGIAAISISSSTKWGLTIDDLQYGRYIPEPPSSLFAILGGVLLITCRRTQGRSRSFLY